MANVNIRVDVNKNRMREFVKLGKERGKILSIEEAFEKYPPEGEWRKDEDGNIVLKPDNIQHHCNHEVIVSSDVATFSEGDCTPSEKMKWNPPPIEAGDIFI